MTEEMKKEIPDLVTEEIGEEFEVFFTKADNNNGTEREVVSVIPKESAKDSGNHIGMVFAINPVEGMEIKGMAREITKVCRECYGGEQMSETFSGLDKDKILAKVEYQVINGERNEKSLMEMPHERLLDLAAIYRVVLSRDEESKLSFIATHSFCKMYKISKEELSAAAKRNMELQGFCIQTAEELLANIAGVPKERFPNLIPMYIIHTQYGDNGAAALLFNSLFEKLSKEADNDLYVLPSSIDEIIVMPVDQKGMGELRNIVESINSSEVPDDLILSDNVYRYCRRTGQLMIV